MTNGSGAAREGLLRRCAEARLRETLAGLRARRHSGVGTVIL